MLIISHRVVKGADGGTRRDSPHRPAAQWSRWSGGRLIGNSADATAALNNTVQPQQKENWAFFFLVIVVIRLLAAGRFEQLQMRLPLKKKNILRCIRQIKLFETAILGSEVFLRVTFVSIPTYLFICVAIKNYLHSLLNHELLRRKAEWVMDSSLMRCHKTLERVIPRWSLLAVVTFFLFLL